MGGALVALLPVLVAGCDGPGPDGRRGADADLRFEGSAASLTELGESVLEALAEDDREALERVRLSEYEHNEVVWPELPASAPGINFPVDYAWQNIEARNFRGVERIVPLYRDRRLDVRRTECRGATEVFESFDVLTDCWVVFTSDDAKWLFQAQIFKDVLVRGGGYKIFRYYDEDPRPLPPEQASSG